MGKATTYLPSPLCVLPHPASPGSGPPARSPNTPREAWPSPTNPPALSRGARPAPPRTLPSLGGLAKVGPGRGLHQPQAPPSPRIDSGAGSVFLLRVLRSSPALPTPPLCPRRYRCSCRCDRCSPPSSSPAGLPACAAPPRRASHPAWELPPTRPGACASRLRFGSGPADGCGRNFM